MEKNTRVSHHYFLIGLGLISLVVYTLILCALSLIRGYPISFWQFPLAILLMLLTQFFVSKQLFRERTKGIFLRTGGLLLTLSFISILIANSIYDISFDGQWYHQEFVSRLKSGFNPYMKTMPVPESEPVPVSKEVWCSGPDRPVKDSVFAGNPPVNLKYLDLNHMAKGTEIAEAAVYRLTNRIETGKAVNLIVLMGSLFLCLSLLYKINRFSTAKKWLISILACFNPVTITQLFSYCVDGVMASILLCLLLVFCFIFLEDNQNYRFLLGLLIIIGANIKYTSLVYTAIFCMGFFLILLIRKKWALTKKSFYTCAISAFLGVIFIGFHPYVTNFISTGQVFYGLKETRNEIYDITPSVFRDKNRFEKLFLSLGTHSNDQAADKESVKEILKVPFSLNKKDLLNANNPELKLSGFGPFFSGALLLSIALLLASFLFYRQRLLGIALSALGIILISVFIISDSWWARFVPQLWLFPVIILIMSEWLPSTRTRYLKAAVYIAVGMNVAWALPGIFYNIVISSHINYQMERIKALSQPISLEYCAYRPFSSNGIRLSENRIPFIEKKVEGKYIYNLIHSNTRISTGEELPGLPEPFLMKLNARLKSWYPD